jgi:hypothetical protein
MSRGEKLAKSVWTCAPVILIWLKEDPSFRSPDVLWRFHGPECLVKSDFGAMSMIASEPPTSGMRQKYPTWSYPSIGASRPVTPIKSR